MGQVDYVARAEAYVHGVLAGDIPANRWARLACERHRRDLTRSIQPAPPFYLDEKSANHACAFIERCPHIEGEWAARGETLTLQPWQAFIVTSLFGWRLAESNARRFTTGYVEVPRKNGKSALAAPVLLYMLAVDGEAGAKCYSAATKMAQARIVFDVAREMARRMSEFRTRCGVTVEQHSVKLADGASALKPLEAKKLDGLNVHCAVVDELHEHPTPDVYDALDQARGARRQSLLLAITTAGDDISGICYQQHDYVTRLLEGVQTDDSYFGVIYCADEGDDAFDEHTWAKANPNLGVSKSVEYVRTQADQARYSPARRGAFLRKHLDIWTSAGATAFDMDKWRAAEDLSLRREDFAGLGGVTGLDLAIKGDLCAVVTAFELDDGRVVVFGDYHVSEAVARDDGNEHLLGWISEGHLRMHPGHLIDLNEVETDARNQMDQFGSVECGFDPHLAAQMAVAMADDGYPMTEFRQTPMNMHAPFQWLQGLVDETRLVTNGDPVLRWMAANTVVEARGEFERPAKLRGSNKIDGISALVSALGVLRAPDEGLGESVYETRGLRIL